MAMSKMSRLLLALLTLCSASPAFAWWEYGHETVARIAWIEASPKTRTAIRRLIAHSAELATPSCPIHNIADASVWADCIKPLKNPDGKYRFQYAYSWHYQDVDVCKPFDVATPCADGNCVSTQVTRQAAMLSDRRLSAKERLTALAFLVHFVGDLHQPLHAGEHDDQGANKVSATYGMVAGKKLNLHSIWDGYLAERAISSPPASARGLLAGVSLAQRRAMATGTVTDWSRESWAVSRTSVYGTALPDPCGPAGAIAHLDDATIAALVPVVRLQVLRGGLRLGRMLNRTLG
ncbi:S1/P1 nuclease [soil metagenome]